jgi:type III secretion protein S
MQTHELVAWTQKALWLLMLTAAPAVIVSAVVGLLIAVVQAATQLQDQSISQSAKLGAVALVLLVSGAWMGVEVFRFADSVLRDLPGMVRKT